VKHQAASTLANKLGELNRYASVTALTIEIDAIDESLLEEYAVVYMSDIDKVNSYFCSRVYLKYKSGCCNKT